MRLCYIILGGTGDNAIQLLNKKYEHYSDVHVLDHARNRALVWLCLVCTITPRDSRGLSTCGNGYN